MSSPCMISITDTTDKVLLSFWVLTDWHGTVIVWESTAIDQVDSYLNLQANSVEAFGLEYILARSKQPKYNWTVRTTLQMNRIKAGYVDSMAKDCIKIPLPRMITFDYKKHLVAAITFMTKQLKVSGGTVCQATAMLTSIQSVRAGYLFVFQDNWITNGLAIAGSFSILYSL